MGILDTIKGKLTELSQKSAAREQVAAAILAAVADGALSDAEIATLQSMFSEHGLSLADIEKIRVQAYKKAFDVASADGAITAQEESELAKIQSFLKIPDSDVSATKLSLARLRLATEIQAGNLPIVAASGVILQKSEIAHWIEPASLLEERVVARRYEGGSQGFSFKIAKGLTYRVGQSRGRLVTDKEVQAVSRGEIVVTDRRVIFRGDAKSFEIRLEKLLEVEMFSDGVRLTGSTGKPRIVKFLSDSNADIFGSVLSLAINRGS